MHPLVEICQMHRIQTRIVEVDLGVELSLCEDEKEFLDEFFNLSYGGENLKRIFEQWEYRDKGENPILLEILFEMYQRIVSIEKTLKSSKDKLLELEKKDRILAIGHGVLWLELGTLEAERDYYLRFVLPGFSDRIIGVFARALSSNVVLITKMDSKDTQEFDHFIASVEMECIRQRKKNELHSGEKGKK